MQFVYIRIIKLSGYSRLTFSNSFMYETFNKHQNPFFLHQSFTQIHLLVNSSILLRHANNLHQDISNKCFLILLFPFIYTNICLHGYIYQQYIYKQYQQYLYAYKYCSKVIAVNQLFLTLNLVTTQGHLCKIKYMKRDNRKISKFWKIIR